MSDLESQRTVSDSKATSPTRSRELDERLYSLHQSITEEILRGDKQVHQRCGTTEEALNRLFLRVTASEKRVCELEQQINDLALEIVKLKYPSQQ
jgi:hypothetical protein